MAVQKEIWIALIAEAIFANNDFMQYALNGDEFVDQGKTVHLPQAGAPTDVDENITSFPIDASERSDDDITFDLDTLYVKPARIRNVEQVEVSYNKLQSVMSQNMKNLSNRAALRLLYRWACAQGGAVAASIIRTTGTAITATGTGWGATGNRLAFVKENLKSAQTLMNTLDIPAEGRKALLPAEWMDLLVADTDVKNSLVSGDTVIVEGKVKRLYGFDIMTRSKTLVYNNAGTPVAQDPKTALAASSGTKAAYNNAALCWHPDFVYRCLGQTELFVDEGNPMHYGTIISYEQRFGGSKARKDGAGIVAIVETASA